jgi:hypothetical protein
MMCRSSLAQSPGQTLGQIVCEVAASARRYRIAILGQFLGRQLLGWLMTANAAEIGLPDDGLTACAIVRVHDHILD